MGGVRTHVEMLQTSPLNEAFDLRVLQVGGYGPSEPFLRKMPRLITNPVRLGIALRSFRPHVVHLNPSFDDRAFWRDALFIAISKAYRVPVLVQFHGGQPEQLFGRHKVLAGLMQVVLRLADQIVVLSNSQKSSLVAHIPSKRVLQLPNMIDAKSFAVAHHDRGGSRPVRVLFLSRLIRSKGIYELLEAASLILPRKAAVEFHVAGDGEERMAVERQARLLGLGSNMIFHGYVQGDEKRRLLSSCDVFVMPSYSEGFPYALLEAMAAGLAVVASPVGAIVEMVEDGINGFLVPPKRADMLAERIIALVQDNALCESMGRLNRAMVEKHYDLNVVSQRFAAIYNSLADRRVQDA